jgi:hypothetical protein
MNFESLVKTKYFKALEIGYNFLITMKVMHLKYNLCYKNPVFA